MSQGEPIDKHASTWPPVSPAEAEADTSLLFQQAERIVISVLRRLGRDDRDLEDTRQDILVSLLQRLRSKRRGRIKNLQAYAAQASFNQIKRIASTTQQPTTKALADPLIIELVTGASNTRADALRICDAIR